MKIQIQALHKTHILQKNKNLHKHIHINIYFNFKIQLCILTNKYTYELKFIHMHTYRNTYSHSNIQYTNKFISTRDNSLTKASKFHNLNPKLSISSKTFCIQIHKKINIFFLINTDPVIST